MNYVRPQSWYHMFAAWSRQFVMHSLTHTQQQQWTRAAGTARRNQRRNTKMLLRFEGMCRGAAPKSHGSACVLPRHCASQTASLVLQRS